MSWDNDYNGSKSAYISYNVTAGITYTLLLSENDAFFLMPTATGTYNLTITDIAGSTLTVTSGGITTSVTSRVSSVPEPATYGLMGAAGLAGLGLLRRRRQQKR